MKTYILQKDLPDYKAGEEFIYEGLYYKAKTPCKDEEYGRWPTHYVENNPEWFKVKEEKTYTEEELLKAKRNAFFAARLRKPYTDRYRFETFEEYQEQ